MRDDFSSKDKDILARRVGYHCSNPTCQKLTVGPNQDPGKTVSIGVAAHITAAAPGGPRYDKNLTSEQRSSLENGLWLCQSCSKLIDSDCIRYTKAILLEWKQEAESSALANLEGANQLTTLTVKPISLERPNYLMPDAFVQRQVIRIEKAHKSQGQPDQEFVKVTTLTNLFDTNPPTVGRRVLLRSHAGVGKSTELAHVAHYFTTADKRYYPILISLRNYVDQEITTLLRKYRSNWENIPEPELLLILDGLDEVKTEERENFIRRIGEFIETRPACNALISCRSNFTTDAPQFSSFSFYLLPDFSDQDVHSYVVKVLDPTAVADFLAFVENRQFMQWLRNPFNLVHFVTFYQADPTTVPQSRIQLLRRVENIKLNDDLKKRHLSNEKIVYRRRLMKLAFAMNLLGVNSLSNAELHVLFPDSVERNSFQFFSLVVMADERITFTHNILQEYFSALVLAEHSFEQICKCITFPPALEKLKPKWLNTIGILLEQLLSTNCQSFRPLLDLVCQEEPQLLLTLEYDHFDQSLRLELFQRILRQPNRIYNREAYYSVELAKLGGIALNPEPLDFLLTEVKNLDSSVRGECLFYLRFANKNCLFGYKQDITDVVVPVLQEDNVYLQEQAVDVLIDLELKPPGLELFLTNEVPNRHYFPLRDTIYKYLNQSVPVNDYVDFYLDGFAVHDAYIRQNSTSYSGFSHGLVDGIEAMNTSAALHKLIDFFSTKVELLDDNESLLSHGFMHEERFLVVFTKRLSEGYREDKSLYNKAFVLYQRLCQEVKEQLIDDLSRFFWLTDTHQQAFFALLNSNETRVAVFSGLNQLISEEAVLTCVSLYRNQEISPQQVWDIISSLNYSKQGELSERFRQAVNEVGRDDFVYSTAWIDKHQVRRQYDLALLLDQQGFLTKVEEIFTDYGTDELRQDQLLPYRSNWQVLDNQVAVSYLNRWCRDTKTVRKEEVLNYLRNVDHWDDYSIGLLLNEFRNGKDLLQAHRDRVIAWCYQKLPEADFSNAITQHSDSKLTPRLIEYRIAEFYMLLDLTFDEHILLDMLSFDAHGFVLSRSQKNKISLSQKILETITDSDKVKARILQNLKDGIPITPVLHNHIALCGQLRIKEALPLIKRVLEESDKQQEYQLIRSLEIYLELGGSLNGLVFVFDCFAPNNDFHWALLERFAEISSYRKSVGRLLLRSVEAGSIDWRQPRVIRLLITVGYIEGLQFFVRAVKETNQIPEGYRWIQSMKALPGLEAAHILHDLLTYSLTHTIQGDRFQDATELTMGYLREVALLQEETYRYTYDALARLIDSLPNYEKQFFLKRSLFNLEKEYYLQKTDYTTVAEVKPVVDTYLLL